MNSHGFIVECIDLGDGRNMLAGFSICCLQDILSFCLVFASDEWLVTLGDWRPGTWSREYFSQSIVLYYILKIFLIGSKVYLDIGLFFFFFSSLEEGYCMTKSLYNMIPMWLVQLKILTKKICFLYISWTIIDSITPFYNTSSENDLCSKVELTTTVLWAIPHTPFPLSNTYTLKVSCSSSSFSCRVGREAVVVCDTAATRGFVAAK